MGSEWGKLDNKKKKKWKKWFFQHLSVPSCYSSHKHCLFSGWTKRLTEMPSAPLNAELNALINHGIRMRPAWLQKKKKKEKKDFFSIYQYHRVTVPTNIACSLVEPSDSQKCQGHHWMQNWMLYSTMGSEWGQLDNKKKKNEKKTGFFSIYQYHPVTVPRNIVCFLVEQSVSQKSQERHWMQNWMLYTTMGSEWGQLDNKKKEKSKNRFFQHLSVPPGCSSHEHCLFRGWTKRLTEMPRAPLDAELNALFNHGVRMRPVWLQKKKKKRFFRYITAVVTWKFHEHFLFSRWTKRLTEMPRAPMDAELNALFNPAVEMRTAWQ